MSCRCFPVGSWTRRVAARAAVLLVAATAACRPAADEADAPKISAQSRDAALSSARVWAQPAVPVSAANFRDNPSDLATFSPEQDVLCRFTRQPVGGTTPKFYCELPGGDIVKVKYGAANPELYAEVAATRLLTALGFWTDRMFVVRSVRCAGCPTFPFQSLRCLERIPFAAACIPGGMNYEKETHFPAAVLERKLPGRVLEAAPDQGWAWYELNRIDPERGGSSKAEVDALRLIAVFLAHWDNKSANQRLVCAPGADRPDGSCAQPLALMQDLGATFGPTKLDLWNWRRQGIWQDAATCTVSMKHLPFGGATFQEVQISEAGRRHLLGLLEQLSDGQLRELFQHSRVTSIEQVSAEARNPDAWVSAFKEKVAQVRDAGPCG